jgi:halogenation protein CepH
MNTNNNFDVIVMGGGPAGSSVAGILAREGRKVIVFEKRFFRVITLVSR